MKTGEIWTIYPIDAPIEAVGLTRIKLGKYYRDTDEYYVEPIIVTGLEWAMMKRKDILINYIKE